MSFYRIYKYPLGECEYRHIYFKRDRWNGRPRKKSKEEGNSLEILRKLEEREREKCHLSRARRTVRDLILCNRFDYFCTFTFSPQKVEDRHDLKAVKSKITKLFAHYKERYSPDFRYLLVPEQHKDGAWHFHGMVSGIRPKDFTVPATYWKHPFKGSEELVEVPNTKGYVDWAYYSKKLGFFNCSRIRHYAACAQYVSKYITKELVNVPRGQQIVLASKNLHRPELVFDCDSVPCEFASQFQDDFCMIAWAGQDFTVGKYVAEWAGECCSELYEDDEAAVIFTPLFGTQLSL